MVIASGTLQVEKGIVNLDSFVATNEKEFIKLEKWCEKKYVSIKPAISRFALRSNATLITLDYEILGMNKRDADLTYKMALIRLNDLFGKVEELRKNDLREEITDAEIDDFLRISGINGRNNGRSRNNLSHGSDSGFHYLYRWDDTFPQMDKKRQQRRQGE